MRRSKDEWNVYFSQLIDKISTAPQGYLIPYGVNHPDYKEPQGEPLIFSNAKFLFYHGAREKDDRGYDKTRPHPGKIRHFGDEPYSISAVADQFVANQQITDKHVEDRRKSVSQALAVYIPIRPYIEFLNDFVEHAASHEAASDASIDWAFKHSFKQIRRLTDPLCSTNELKPEALLGKRRQDARRVIMQSGRNIGPAIARDPALELAFVLYRAAHIEYLDRMIAAVEQKDLPPEQKAVALDVLKYSFDQFRVNVADMIFMPLIAMEYKQQVPSVDFTKDAINPDTMKAAIQAGFERGFELGVFETDMVGGRGMAQCPAQGRVSVTAKGRDAIGELGTASGVVGIYDYINHNREAFKPLLDRVKHDLTCTEGRNKSAAR